MSSGSVKAERKLARMSNVWRALITKEGWKTRLVFTQLLKFFSVNNVFNGYGRSCNYSPVSLHYIL